MTGKRPGLFVVNGGPDGGHEVKEVRKRRARDPVATREVILEAARALLARDGPEGISVAGVATLAGVNRGTAYQHFATREELVAAATASVSDLLFRAAFGDPATVTDRRVEEVDVSGLSETLADFAVDNPALCRVWFLQLLASDEPSHDPFWREYYGSMHRFTQTDLAQPGIDTEVAALIFLAGNFLWPVWTKSHERSKSERRALAHRFAHECLRLSLHGTMRPECFPQVTREVDEEPLGHESGRETRAA